MDYLEAIQLPTSRTFWNSHEPPLDDPFDETLVQSTIAPMEACSSTFLFPSTSSTCNEIGDCQGFKRPPYQQPIFDEESRATAETYYTNTTPAASCMADSSQFSWPHYPQQGVGDSQAQVMESLRVQPTHHSGVLMHDVFGALNSSAQGSSPAHNGQYFGHGEEYQTFNMKPLMRQPTYRRPDSSLQLNTRASWQQSSMSFEQRRVFHKEPLGSPCSVINGFTKGGDPVSSDYNMESLGASTSAAQNIQESSALTAGEGAPQSVSETHDASGFMKSMRPKRKRSKTPKHGDEVESQRMTHIAVERNRRKQMNEHLAALRALMPGSYVQKGDQASIVGGAIEFVKELEHLLHCLQAQKRRRAYSDLTSNALAPTSRSPVTTPDHHSQMQPLFSFHSPQRLVDQSPFVLGTPTEPLTTTTRHPQSSSFYPRPHPLPSPASSSSNFGSGSVNESIVGEAKSDMASVEVKMVGSEQAMVKIMAPRRSGQLLRTVVALESLALAVMHTNITTVHNTVLYSFHVQVGHQCHMNVAEIAAALHQTFSSLHSLHF